MLYFFEGLGYGCVAMLIGLCVYDAIFLYSLKRKKNKSFAGQCEKLVWDIDGLECDTKKGGHKWFMREDDSYAQCMECKMFEAQYIQRMRILS